LDGDVVRNQVQPLIVEPLGLFALNDQTMKDDGAREIGLGL
jgi:hypothetical protein